MLRTSIGTMALISGLGMTGCAASIHTSVLEPVRLEPTASRAAVLAVMPGTSDPGSEWLRPEIMAKLTDALARELPGVEIVGPEEAARHLADQSLASEYSSILADFDRAGVVDAERIEALLSALQATHALQLRVGYASEGLQRATTLLDNDPVFYDTKNQNVLAVARLWGPAGIGPSWEAVVRSGSQAGPFSRDREPIELVDSLVLAVANRIPLESPATASTRP